MAKTSLCGSDLELAKPPTGPRVNVVTVCEHMSIFVQLTGVCQN